MLSERKLTPSELSKREDILTQMKKNKISLVKKYGKDAEKVMYGRATNEEKLKEAIRGVLSTPIESRSSKLTEIIFSRLRNK